MIKFVDFIIYWAIIVIPFSMAIAPAPMNGSMGLLIAGFLAKKIMKNRDTSPFLLCKKGDVSLFFKLPLFFLFIITCISIVNSVDFKDTFKGGILRLLQYIIVTLSMAEEIKDKRHIQKILISLSFGIILASFNGIWQVITGYDFIRGYAPIINLGLVRATSSFKDSNTYGIYLSAITPVILGLTLYYKKGVKKIILEIISFIALIAIISTFSRPTLLAVFIVLVFLAITRKDKILIGLLIILTLVSPFLLPKSVKEWAKQVDYNPLRFMCNDDRIAIYRNSLNIIKAHPVIGVGANTFMKNYKKYKESPEYRNIITADYLYAHNNFLHITAEIGLSGLVIFLWFLLKLFKESFNIYKTLNDTYLKNLSLALIASLIAFQVNGLTESSLYSSRVAMIFWYIAGFSLALKKFIYADRT